MVSFIIYTIQTNISLLWFRLYVLFPPFLLPYPQNTSYLSDLRLIVQHGRLTRFFGTREVHDLFALLCFCITEAKSVLSRVAPRLTDCFWTIGCLRALPTIATLVSASLGPDSGLLDFNAQSCSVHCTGVDLVYITGPDRLVWVDLVHIAGPDRLLRADLVYFAGPDRLYRADLVYIAGPDHLIQALYRRNGLPKQKTAGHTHSLADNRFARQPVRMFWKSATTSIKSTLASPYLSKPYQSTD